MTSSLVVSYLKHRVKEFRNLFLWQLLALHVIETVSFGRATLGLAIGPRHLSNCCNLYSCTVFIDCRPRCNRQHRDNVKRKLESNVVDGDKDWTTVRKWTSFAHRNQKVRKWDVRVGMFFLVGSWHFWGLKTSKANRPWTDMSRLLVHRDWQLSRQRREKSAAITKWMLRCTILLGLKKANYCSSEGSTNVQLCHVQPRSNLGDSGRKNAKDCKIHRLTAKVHKKWNGCLAHFFPVFDLQAEKSLQILEVFLRICQLQRLKNVTSLLKKAALKPLWCFSKQMATEPQDVRDAPSNGTGFVRHKV